MKNKTILIFFFILILGAFLRFYNLEQITGFDWDQEQTAQAAKKILIDKKPTLIGMETGHGGVFMGSGYYYLYSISYATFKMDPFGAPILAVFISLASIVLLFYIGNKYFLPGVGLFASFIYSVSHYVIRFDQTVWSANLIVPLSLLTLLGLLEIKNKKSWGFYMLGFSLGFSLHAHFTLIILFPICFLALFLMRKNIKFKLTHIVLSLIIIFLFFLPLVIFDLRHNFLNSRALTQMILVGGSGSTNLFVNFVLMTIASLGSLRTIFVWENFLVFLDFLLFVFLVWFGFHFTWRNKNKDEEEKFRLLLFFIIIPILFFSFYRGPFSNYYYLISFSSFILISSYSLCKIFERINNNIWRSVVIIFIVIMFGSYNIYRQFQEAIRYSTSSLKFKKEAVSFINSSSKNNPIRISVTAEKPYDSGFSYLFYFYNLKITDNKSAPIYTIVIPAHFQKINPQYIFGNVGIIGPKYD